ncbi:6-phospho-beta-glucosidase [Leucobacter sp. gxy201]|uniref:family 4 glycosyl hydrolase n=1 Tax=Leucobacter sp. gxy201 TaxID=2957200 RepID=UPI003D9FDC2D
MKLTVIGGGGFRIPQLFSALGDELAPIRVTDLHLHDVQPERLDTIRKILDHLAPGLARPPRVTTGTDLDAAVTGANFIFSAMRIGGIDGRIADERTALDLGVLGQETVGPGGLAYALRTVPVVTRLAERVRDLAPEAWLINFTNPAGLVTETMRRILGDRVIGICDTPIGLMRRATRAAGAAPDRVEFDYVGLNHLGWLRSLSVDGVDRLPGILASDDSLTGIEEARLMGFDWIRTIGALPNEYLYYYYFTREATARIRSGTETRGEYLKRQQDRFYAESRGAGPAETLEMWQAALRDREFSYMAESRAEADRDARLSEDVEDGGYQRVAIELMTALSGGSPATMILNVGNRGNVAGLPDEAVIEVPCRVDAAGVHPQRVAEVAGDMLGLMQQVKAAEQLTLEASLHRDARLAWRGIAAHPLVDSVAVARQLFDAYRERIPGVRAVFD